MTVNQESAPTSATMLHACENGDSAAWNRLIDVYSPLVLRWMKRWGLIDAEACDVTQDVFTAVFSSLSSYDPDRGRFRSWLYGVAIRCVQAHWRRENKQAVQLAVGGTDAKRKIEDVPIRVDEINNEPDTLVSDRHLVVRQLLNQIKAEVKEATWTAFYQVVLEGRTADDVAADLGLSRNSVYLAKSRVLKRFKQRCDELLCVLDSPEHDSQRYHDNGSF